MCPPFWNLKKKKKKKKGVWFRPAIPWLLLTPPPPDVDGAPKKKVLESPPPRLSAFLGLARVSRLAAVLKKTVCYAPPFSNSWIRRWLSCLFSPSIGISLSDFRYYDDCASELGSTSDNACLQAAWDYVQVIEEAAEAEVVCQPEELSQWLMEMYGSCFSMYWRSGVYNFFLF